MLSRDRSWFAKADAFSKIPTAQTAKPTQFAKSPLKRVRSFKPAEQYHHCDTTTARELTNPQDGLLKDKKYLILDRETTFNESFRGCLQKEGVKPVPLALPT